MVEIAHIDTIVTIAVIVGGGLIAYGRITAFLRGLKEDVRECKEDVDELGRDTRKWQDDHNKVTLHMSTRLGKVEGKIGINGKE